MSKEVKKQAALKQYNLVVYPIDLVVAIGDVEEEVNNIYKPYEERYNRITPPQSRANATVYHVKDNTGVNCVMVWYRNSTKFKNSFIAHESAHVAMDIFSYIGAKVDYDNQEPFTYLVGNIARLTANTFFEIEKNTYREE